MPLKTFLKSQLASRGYELIKKPDDLDAAFEPMRAHASRYTGSPVDKAYGLYEAIKYIAANHIPGEFVECGVGAGGSSVLAALAMKHFKTPRPIWMFDTFEGMPEPGEHDKSAGGTDAKKVWTEKKDAGGWFRYTLDQVKAAMNTTQYAEPIHYIQGKVEETIPKHGPASISILRLDTDFYESTLHELKHFYPRLAIGGVLFIDDYYAWQGAKRAVEEYFESGVPRPMLTRLTSGARIGIKVTA